MPFTSAFIFISVCSVCLNNNSIVCTVHVVQKCMPITSEFIFISVCSVCILYFHASFFHPCQFVKINSQLSKSTGIFAFKETANGLATAKSTHLSYSLERVRIDKLKLQLPAARKSMLFAIIIGMHGI